MANFRPKKKLKQKKTEIPTIAFLFLEASTK